MSNYASTSTWGHTTYPAYPSYPTHTYYDHPDVEAGSSPYEVSAVRSTLPGATPPPSPIQDRHHPLPDLPCRTIDSTPESQAPLPPSLSEQEVYPGVLESGLITANHPCVRDYLERFARYIQLSARAFEKQPEGMARVPKATIEGVKLMLGIKLSDLQCRAIYALGALKILPVGTRHDHACFWGTHNRKYTDEVILSVLRTSFLSSIPHW
ncbi:hypothetical protein BKA93DRAFT_600950 [Sparassis latifolia]